MDDSTQNSTTQTVDDSANVLMNLFTTNTCVEILISFEPIACTSRSQDIIAAEDYQQTITKVITVKLTQHVQHN